MTAPRIAYNAGLDGIRGIAVLLVILTHAGGPSGAAWVGVVMFFALSGYLITRLLVAEVESTGRIDRFGFYARRAGRLLPALLAMVLIVVAINLTRGYDHAVQDGVASLLYASSWLEASGDYLVGLAADKMGGYTAGFAVIAAYCALGGLVALPVVRRLRA